MDYIFGVLLAIVFATCVKALLVQRRELRRLRGRLQEALSALENSEKRFSVALMLLVKRNMELHEELRKSQQGSNAAESKLTN